MLVKKNEILGFGGKEIKDIKSLIDLLPSSLKINRDNYDMDWVPNLSDKSTISASISIPAIKGKKGSWLQSIIVLSFNLAKKIFSMSQRIINTVDHKEVSKRDVPYFKNEPFKNSGDLIDKIKDSLISIKKNLTDTVQKLGYGKNKESFNKNKVNETDDKSGVIVKVGNKWKIRGKKMTFWPAEYDTKSDAEAALRAYWANKKEFRNNSNKPVKLEFFNSINGNELLKRVGLYLRKIFGSSFYFDHITDNAADLMYRGKEVAKMAYNDDTEEIAIIPDNKKYPPVAFYDTSEYEINDYLSDLLLGDVNVGISAI